MKLGIPFSVIREYLFRCLLLLLSVSGLSALFITPMGIIHWKAELLITACTFLLFAFLAYPFNLLARYFPRYNFLVWISTCYVLWTSFATMSQLAPSISISLISGMAIALLLFVLISLTQMLSRIPGITWELAPFVSLLTLVTCSLLPIWAGVLPEYVGDGETTANLLVGLSPLSYLSVMLDYDYLHSDWFYRNTPFGGLRFEYLNPLLYSTLFFIFACILLVIGKNSLPRRLAIIFKRS